MKYAYKGTEPCRIGSNLVKSGDVYEFADHPGALWMPVPPENIPMRVMDAMPKPKRPAFVPDTDKE